VTIARSTEKVKRWLLRKPYLHLYHADRTPYMERWWILETRWLMVKVHHICSPDYDRHMHDHPWWFASLILRGWYVEHRPKCEPAQFVGDRELSVVSLRSAGSMAFRKLGARHRITQVSPGGVWTLFINGPRAKRWGFHTEEGWVYWKDYPSCHAAGQVTY
jgi:hypothetical protein